MRRESGTLPHHAEVDEHQHPALPAGCAALVFDGGDEQVAGVRVGVEEAVFEDLLQVGVQQARSHLRPVDPGSLDGGVVGDLDGQHVFQRQGAAGGVRPDHLRDAHARIAVEVEAEGVGVFSFRQVIDLFIQNTGELVQQSRDVGPPPDRAVALQPLPDGVQGGQVGLDDLLDVRPLHLDHHVHDRPGRRGIGLPVGAGFGQVALAQPGTVHLAQGGRRQRLRIEFQEFLFQRGAEFGFGHPPDVGEVFGRHFVLQSGQLGGDHLRQHVDARGQELPDLDHHPAQSDSKQSEISCAAFQALLPGALRPAAQSQARHQQIPEDDAQDDACKEGDDTQVAQAEHAGEIIHYRFLWYSWRAIQNYQSG